jgi:hypothetical protein
MVDKMEKVDFVFDLFMAWTLGGWLMIVVSLIHAASKKRYVATDDIPFFCKEFFTKEIEEHLPDFFWTHKTRPYTWIIHLMTIGALSQMGPLVGLVLPSRYAGSNFKVLAVFIWIIATCMVVMNHATDPWWVLRACETGIIASILILPAFFFSNKIPRV